MESIQKIVSCLEARQKESSLFIAIDGHSAAGKSTLAHNLAEVLSQAELVFTDDFYRPMEEAKRFALNAQEAVELYYDWQRLHQEVLVPLSMGQLARFQIYDWGNNQLGQWKQVTPSKYIIVEGCYSGRIEFSSIMDLVVLVETPSEERKRRQRIRDDASQAWQDRWEAAERYYMETTQLKNRADVIISDMIIFSSRLSSRS